MSQRYGRKRRRAHVARVASLTLKLWESEGSIDRLQREKHSLMQRITSYDAMLKGMAEHARADVMAQMSAAIKHAETELLRRGLEEMRSAGMSNMEFAAVHREMATIMQIRFRVPEIQFAVLTQPIAGQAKETQ